MAHRTVLTSRQRSKLFDLPRQRSILMAHYVLGGVSENVSLGRCSRCAGFSCTDCRSVA